LGRAMTVLEADDGHFLRVAGRLLEGKVVPFLGAGANLCGRPPDAKFTQGTYLPSGAELAELFVQRSGYPVPGDDDLLRVSQWVEAVLGEKTLYEWLRSTFDADYPPTVLHRFLARVAKLLRDQGKPPMLILTTNYDDALERAFDDAIEPYHLIWYEAKKGKGCGRFVHDLEPEPKSIDRPNEYRGLDGDRAVIVKLHGAIDRHDAAHDSYVITEDNYVDYLTRSDIAKQIPMTVREQMSASHFLFLGYSLRDWNLRVVLRRIWGKQEMDLKSWAIQRAAHDARLTEIDQKLWSSRGDIDLLCIPLDIYVEGVDASLQKQLNGHS
jgi:SIR2-like protein